MKKFHETVHKLKRKKYFLVKTKIFCIPESFNTNISHQVFDYLITFVNSSSRTPIQKVILFSKTSFRFLVYKINPTQIWYDKFN